jgi:hypothetical protein
LAFSASGKRAKVKYLRLDPELAVEMRARFAAGEEVHPLVIQLMETTSIDPGKIVRKKNIGPYLGLKTTAAEELIATGALGPLVHMRPGGIATGIQGSFLLGHQIKMLLLALLGKETAHSERLVDKAQHMRTLKAAKTAHG